MADVDIESGTERELTSQKFFNIKHVAWLPAQDGLLITAARVPNKHFGIWQVSPATGEARPLTRDSETYSVLSVDKTADVVVSTQIKEDFHLLLFQMENPTSNRVLTEGTRLTFAPDGKILFSSMTSGNNEIWSIGADGGEKRQLTNDVADDVQPVASPDKSSIFFASNRTGEAHVWRMNPDGSSQTQITHKEGGFPLVVSPDLNWLYYHHGVSGTLWRVSLRNSEEQLIHDKAKYLFTLSPDDSQFAFVEKQGDETVVVIVSLASGQTARTVRIPRPTAKVVEFRWVPDGKSLIYVLANNENEQNAVWLQPLDSGLPRKIADLGDEAITHFAIARDGKSFAISQGGWKHDAVLLKGLK